MRLMNRILLAAVLIGFLGGAGECTRAEDTTQKGLRTQENIMKRAMSETAVPETHNFLTRKTVAKWLRRQDVPDRPYYVYILAMTGQPVGYFVAQSRPVNICTFLTPPERVIYSRHNTGVAQGTAPALDGVYYKGAGCNQWYFFDAETDAMIEITTDVFGIFSTDQPLEMDIKPIKVQVNG